MFSNFLEMIQEQETWSRMDWQVTLWLDSFSDVILPHQCYMDLQYVGQWNLQKNKMSFFFFNESIHKLM